MNEPNTTPDNDDTTSENIAESLAFIVNMMNEGNADPREVYPPNRYCGD